MGTGSPSDRATGDNLRNRRILYGRRAGHSLKPGQRVLMETLLPRLTVDVAAPIDPEKLFGRVMDDLWFEVGFGGGEHLASLARDNPAIGFIGCEPFLNGVAKLLTHVDAAKLDNVRIHPDDARDVLDRLPDASLGRVFVLFPDPWPKARHRKRRFIAPTNLDTLAHLMKPGALLRVGTDAMDYAAWTLEQLDRDRRFEWTASSPADWRQRPADWPPTRYEEKALKAGRSCVYLTFRRR